MSDNQNTIPQGATGAPPAKDANDEIIDLVQSVRVKAIKELTEKGLPQATQKEEREFLQSMLQGAASTAVAMKRIKAEENATMSNLAVAQAVAKAVAQARVLRNQQKPSKQDQTVAQIPVKLVPGQTDVGAIPVMSSSIRSLADED